MRALGIVKGKSGRKSRILGWFFPFTTQSYFDSAAGIPLRTGMLGFLDSLPTDCVYAINDSPVGNLWLFASDKGLYGVLWDMDFLEEAAKEKLSRMERVLSHPVIDETKTQLEEYFAGERKEFDLPLVMLGTEFQKRAWQALVEIPYGETVSYEEQAIKLGGKNKARAVGSANSRNPISIIVPCHRVIGKTGSLHGFASGPERKRFLLDHELGLSDTRPGKTTDAFQAQFDLTHFSEVSFRRRL